MKEPHFSNQLESQINKRQLRKLDLEQPLLVTEDQHQFNKINIKDDLEDGENNNTNNNNNEVLEIIDESEIELTLGLGLGPTSYSRSRKTTSDSGPSFSSSSTGSSQMNRTTRLELNDAGGGCQLGLVNGPDTTSSGYNYSSNPNKNNIDDDVVVVEEELRRERLKHHPPWLFQVLSLNMT